MVNSKIVSVKDEEESTNFITLVEVGSKVYPTNLKLAHGTLYLDGYLWILMSGVWPLNPVKIDITNLDKYKGIKSNVSVPLNNMIYAKGYIWSPKITTDLFIRRTDPVTLATKDYDGTGATSVDMASGSMYYDAGTQSIFIGMGGGVSGSGFAIMDISNVDKPSFTYHKVQGVIKGFDNTRFHSICGDGTYVYMCHRFKKYVYSGVIPAVLKVKASDPSYSGKEGWESQQYDLPQTFTDDSFYYNGYLYFATDPKVGAYSYIVKIDVKDLSLKSSKQADHKLGVGCYGVWIHKKFIFALITSSPGKINVYDMDLNLLYSHTLSAKFTSPPNEIIFSDASTMFITLWGGQSLEIVQVKIV